MSPVLDIENLQKSFVMHLRGGIRLPVVQGVSLTLRAGECVALTGPSGAGKSSVMRMIYGNYRADGGHIRIRHKSSVVDMVQARAQEILAVRLWTLGYVSQFLRVIPRVPALSIVAEAAKAQGATSEEAEAAARMALKRLRVPEALWKLPPATFSGGEQQRINIARGFVGQHNVLLLDEPTASLDADNRSAVVDLIRERVDAGAAVLGIFHDEGVRRDVADREIDITCYRVLAA